jgi:NTP pyrophosphatase (non-canonical NTP hydrolase)
MNTQELIDAASDNMNTQDLIDAVREWGVSKGITGPEGRGTLLGQLSKTQEELTETRDAAVEWSITDFDQVTHSAVTSELKDGIGDCTVTLILAAEVMGLRFEDCLEAAYDEIKGRTGKMENGVFIKD